MVPLDSFSAYYISFFSFMLYYICSHPEVSADNETRKNTHRVLMGAFFCVFDKYSSGYSNLEKGMVRLTAEKAAVLAEILRCKQEDFFK